MTISEFQQIVWEHYHNHARSFPWRETNDPYCIVVSELMLQQTQTERVVPKYQTFLATLPSWQALATVDTATLLTLWQGLGYNRRALNLKRMAEVVVQKYGGVLPHDEVTLRELPGIGPYTAGAVQAFAYNRPVAMIETNNRRAFLHHFFADEQGVSDKQLMPLISEAVQNVSPREWYWALMDYGSRLAREHPNANRRSKHYTKQSAFEGSLRQLRGRIVRFVTRHPETTVSELLHEVGQEPERLQQALSALMKEGFLLCEDEQIKLA